MEVPAVMARGGTPLVVMLEDFFVLINRSNLKMNAWSLELILLKSWLSMNTCNVLIIQIHLLTNQSELIVLPPGSPS